MISLLRLHSCWALVVVCWPFGRFALALVGRASAVSRFKPIKSVGTSAPWPHCELETARQCSSALPGSVVSVAMQLARPESAFAQGPRAGQRNRVGSNWALSVAKRTLPQLGNALANPRLQPRHQSAGGRNNPVRR